MLGAAAAMGLAQGPAGRLAVQVGLAAAALDVLHEAVVAAGPGAAQGLAVGPAGPALHLAVGAVAPTLHVPLQRPVVQLPHTKQTQWVRAELQLCTAAPTLAGCYRFPVPNIFGALSNSSPYKGAKPHQDITDTEGSGCGIQEL